MVAIASKRQARSRSPHRPKITLSTLPYADNEWSWSEDIDSGTPIELHTWKHPDGDGTVKFVAVRIAPEDKPGFDEDILPVAFYFSGLGAKVEEVLAKLSNLKTVADEPFLLVVPMRPKGKWWFITDDTEWGWLSGEFDEPGVDLFTDWVLEIISHEQLDSSRVGLFGFSAGAYAVLEIFARGRVWPCGIGLGGVHGHGQSDIVELPRNRREGVTRNFAAFLERLKQHNGVDFLEATHSESDKQSPYKYAKQIFDAVNCRQLELGKPAGRLRLVRPEAQDFKAGGQKNKAYHHYLQYAFFRREFLVALLGGEANPSEEVSSEEVTDDDEEAPRKPAVIVGPAKPPMRPPPTTLDVAQYSVKVQDDGWEYTAFDIFSENGFVVVEGVLKLHQYLAVLKDCERIARKLVSEKRRGNRGPGRYSFGNASSTGSMLHIESYARHLLDGAGGILLPLLALIFEAGDPEEPGFSCTGGGGDFVLEGTTAFQYLHSDVQVPKALQKKLPPPQLSVNFCVQPLTEHNGPTRIIPRTQTVQAPEKEPPEWKRSRLYPVPAGAAFLRDTRTLHGGTPNLSTSVRFLPSIEYASAEFRATNRKDRFPPYRSLPAELYEQLQPGVQELCQEIVMTSDETPKVKFRRC